MPPGGSWRVQRGLYSKWPDLVGSVNVLVPDPKQTHPWRCAKRTSEEFFKHPRVIWLSCLDQAGQQTMIPGS
jgi:hypothetical protein